MSEATTSPAAPASTSSAPAASTASASTSAAVSAPAAATVAAPASTGGAAPAAAETTPSSPASDAGKTTLQVMQEAQAAKEAETAAAVAAAESKPAEGEAAAPAAAEETETPATEEKPAAEEVDDTEIPNFDDFELDPVALAPKELASKIEADAALSAALEGNTELKNEIFANARLAAETAAFKAVVASPEDAKAAVAAHATFTDITSAMLNINDGDLATLQPVMGHMLEASAIRDADGNLQFDDKGNLVTNGMVGRFLRNSFKQRMEMFADQFVKAGDEEGQAAIDILMERAGLRTPSSASDSEEVPAHVQAQLDEVKAERAALAAEKQAGIAQAATTYNTTVNTRIDAMMDAGIGEILSRADGLNDFSRKTVEGNIRQELQKQIKGNRFFRREMDALDALPYGPDRQKKHMAVAKKYFDQGIRSQAVKDRIAEAGASILSKQKAQADKSAARTEAARSEVRGASTPAKTAPALDSAGQVNTVAADLSKTLGRSPTTLEVMQENFRRKSQAA